jgi:hypothetical protein
MIPAIPVDLLFNIGLGVAFALCARERVRADGPFAPPASVMMLSFVGIVLTPITLYLYLAHPAWTWMYLLDPNDVPGLAVVPLLVAHGGAVVIGWYLGARLLIAGKQKAALYTSASIGGCSLLAIALFWGRLGRYGSFEEFQDGRALPIMQVKLGYVMVAVVVAVTIAAGFLGFELTRDGRRVRADRVN